VDTKVQKKIEALHRLYSKNLPAKLQSIEKLWQEIQQHWDLPSFQVFHREVHSLCGSAGTYGYMNLSKFARQMEQYLKAVLQKEVMDSTSQKKISTFVSQLKTYAIPDTAKETLYLETSTSESPENKYVYIMESEAALSQQLLENIKAIGYKPYLMQDWPTLKMAIQEHSPLALIIDTDYLDKSHIAWISELQKETSPIPLFCIVPTGELLPRIDAIRAGSQACFQKPINISDITQILHYKCSTTPSESYRILIIDDSEPLATYYALILNQAGMTARPLTQPLEVFNELESFQPNLIVMDIYMPECSGYELATVLRQESRYTKIPIIFLSTEEDKDKKLYGISLGGDDFLTKPVSPQHLISAVKSRINRANVLNYFMTTDSLTGLLNHSSILKQLDLHLAQSRQARLPLTFVMIDIDNFKKINDTYGHPMGDQVIKKLSTIFLERVRSQDFVGRYGGEEFALILPHASLQDAKILVDELRNQFSQHVFIVDGVHFSVTFSAGLAGFDETKTVQSIIKQADEALYQAKQKGRNRVEF